MNKQAVIGLARHVLTFGGGIIVSQGWVDEATMTTIVGALATIVGAVWSVLDKRGK